MSEGTMQPESGAPIEPPRFRGRKLLFGCLGAFVAVVVIVVICIAAFVAWLRTPGVLMEGRSLVDARTAVYAETHLRPDDPGLLKIFDEMVQEQQNRRDRLVASDPNVTALIRSFLENLPHRKGRQADLDKILPIVVVATRREAEGGGLSPLFFAISAPKVGNRLRFADLLGSFFMRWAKPDSDLRSERYGEEVLYLLDADGRKFWATIRGSDVLVTGEEAAMKETLDRLNGASGPADPSGNELSALLARRPEKASLFLAAREGFASETVDTIADLVPAFGAALRPLVKDAGGIYLWGSLLGTDLLEGELHVLEPALGRPEGGEPDGYSGAITAPYEEGDVTLRLDQIDPAPGDRQAWKIRIEGIAHAVHHLFNEMEKREKGGGKAK